MLRRSILKGTLAAFAASALSLASPALAQTGAAAAAPIRVGHYASMTGKEATFGTSTDNGIRLAIEELNAAGGLNGRRIELITYDTKGASDEAGKAVTRLITSDRVTAVLGEVASGLSLAGGAVAQQYGVPMISPSSTNPSVTRDRPFVFRVCFIDPFQGSVVAKFARETLQVSRVAILFDQTAPYSKGLRDEFKAAFERMGGTIVADQAYSGGDQDFSAQLSTIRTASPEAIFVPGYYTEVGNIALQARRMGIGREIPLLGGDGWDSEQLATIAGDTIEGSFYANHYASDDTSPTIQGFVERYRKRFGTTPDGLAALGYDAMMVLFDAMKRSPSLEGAPLRDAIAATRDFKGVTGSITLNQDRDAVKPAVMVEMRRGDDGKLRPMYVQTINP